MVETQNGRSYLLMCLRAAQLAFPLDACNFFSACADLLARLLEGVVQLGGWFGHFSWVVFGRLRILSSATYLPHFLLMLGVVQRSLLESHQPRIALAILGGAKRSCAQYCFLHFISHSFFSLTKFPI